MKEEKKSGGAPVAIIVAVLVLAAVGGWLYYRTAATPSSNSNRAANTKPVTYPVIDMSGKPTGAQPPNAVGAPSATVTVEEFADFQCGGCAAAYPVIKDILKAYNGNPNFRFIFRNFPLQMHEKAYDAAVAAEAAGLQNPAKFWLMEDQLFTNQQVWSVDANYKNTFNEYASKIGLDMERFKADVAGTQAKLRVDQDLSRGRAIGVGSTPTVLINNKLIPYQEVTLAGMKRIIDAELQAANAPDAAPANSAPANK